MLLMVEVPLREGEPVALCASSRHGRVLRMRWELKTRNLHDVMLGFN